MRQKVMGLILVGVVMGFVAAGVIILAGERQSIGQQAVMAIVQNSMNRPDVQDMLAAQVVNYLKSPQGTKEMIEYLKRPEFRQAMAQQLDTPEFRSQILELMKQPEFRKALLDALEAEPEFKVLKALNEITVNPLASNESETTK